MAPVVPPPAVGAPDAAPPAARSRRPWMRSQRVRLVVALVMAGVLALGVWRLSDGGPAPLTPADVDRAVAGGIEKALQDQRDAPPDAAAAYRRILPSFVTITTGAAPGTAGSGESGLGAGVVVNEAGAVLTALHVVDGDGPITVHFTDGTEASARVSTRRPEQDIAVLTVDQLPEIVVPAVLGGGVQIGDAVFPVGNPLGLQGTLTAGVVSALDRDIRADGDTELAGLIQFDAAVNPGNSGGPLLDRNGAVVGIVTALANPARQPYFVGVGFAVPIATAGGAAGGPRQ